MFVWFWVVLNGVCIIFLRLRFDVFKFGVAGNDEINLFQVFGGFSVPLYNVGYYFISGKGVAPFPTPRCSSYWKGSLLGTLD